MYKTYTKKGKRNHDAPRSLRLTDLDSIFSLIGKQFYLKLFRYKLCISNNNIRNLLLICLLLLSLWISSKEHLTLPLLIRHDNNRRAIYYNICLSHTQFSILFSSHYFSYRFQYPRSSISIPFYKVYLI
jgi:hypothetical protein